MSQKYRVDGMTCMGCAGSVERAIKAVDPQAKVAVDLAAKTVTVDGLNDAAKIKGAVENAGFTFEGII
ncbi:MAG: heavy-metal-associated domain-containing protein [Rhodospirillales bacterium]|nr:heavy-metal-associated domain-containing protein [Rhodospirillales bacterium]